VQSKRSDSVDSATTTAVSGVAARLLAISSLGEIHSHQLRCEEPWHAELRTNFVTLYMQYLQQPGAGFQQIQVLPATSDTSSSQRYTCGLSCTTASALVIYFRVVIYSEGSTVKLLLLCSSVIDFLDLF